MVELSSRPDAAAAADEVERKAIARITPDAQFVEQLAQVRDRLIAAVQSAARSRGSPLIRCLVAGSGARGTFLNDRLDIDLFLLFPERLSKEDLETEGLALGQAVLTEPETRYAEHPYLRGRFEGFTVDAVPGYAITDSSRPRSAVDRTPFHQEYLTARQSPAMITQVRLTKQFLRGLGVYGSESRTEGFSGYLVELLLLRFETLRALLRSAATWRVPTILSNEAETPKRVPKDVALILVDPVDPNRNVATALSRRNLALFILGAQEYLRHPTDAWFEPQAPALLTLDEGRRRVSERGTHVCVIRLPRPALVDDILFPQIRKAERALLEEAERLGFQIVGSAHSAPPHEILIALEATSPRLPAVKSQLGPPAGIDRVGNFLSKWGPADQKKLQGPYLLDDGRLAVEAHRSVREIEPALRQAIHGLPLGRDLKAVDPEEVWVRSLANLPATAPAEEVLTRLLDKRLPWIRAG